MPDTKVPSDHHATARRRVVIENVTPSVDGGAWPAKRVAGDWIDVEADVFADGHDVIRAEVHSRDTASGEWHVSPMAPQGNDHFHGGFRAAELGEMEFYVRGWVDQVGTWWQGALKKRDAGNLTHVDLQIGAQLLEDAAARAGSGDDARSIRTAARALADAKVEPAKRLGSEAELGVIRAAEYPAANAVTQQDPPLRITVHPRRARFSSWYEFFPRSCGPADRHGTFADAAEHLEYVAELGFDVVYLPPIHPIGVTFRKGKNNSLECEPGEPGSPWAIGAAEGGHKAIHPELGTFEDFDAFVKKARELGLEVALDIAFQASPDHPWVKEHPEWFTTRPDGTIQYAENPPKKYQDIYPLNFDSEDWEGLWTELKSVFEFWIRRGVRVFRVDNPHTKSLRFWEWCLAELHHEHPEVIFLSEAFTRPRLMYRLAKLGFTQSYTYFTWRNSAAEFRDYLEELTATEVAEFFGPNFWPNTPDILPEHLQHGGRAAFVGRLVLAATLTSSYGMYGPAFELMEHVPRPGSGEYIDNEKYELKSWDLGRPDSLRHLIRRINRIRHDHPALHDNRSLVFHPVDNDQLLVYSKRHAATGDDESDDVILVVVNLDWWHTQSGFVELDLEALGLSPHHSFVVHDLVTEARFHWSGSRNYVELPPNPMPAHVFHLTQS